MLPSTYSDRNCSLARTLEVVGERWTLLIIRNAFYGIRRFGGFADQLRIPRAVLTDRLKTLVQEGVLSREDESGGVEYRLTDKGIALWPVLRAMMSWGDAYYSPNGVRRVLRHDLDGGLLDDDGRCQDCGAVAAVPDIRIEPGPGFERTEPRPDAAFTATDEPRRLLDPIDAPRAR
jgi:DNA-binding HxlR family transcriptional regulator